MNLRLPFVTLAVAGAATALHVSPTTTAHLQFDRAALAAGEWWRLFTGHLTHFDANHLVWDVGMLLALGFVTERESGSRCAWALALAAAAISGAVWWWQPQFTTYRGLSGLDSALFGLFAGKLLLR